MSVSRFTAFAVIASAGLAAGFAPSALADDVTIFGNLDYPDGAEYYELAGQSAFIQLRPDGSTSGGQLDGVTSGSAAEGFSITFFEVFPPPAPTLENYSTFCYFGLIETYGPEDTLLDRSLVIAMNQNDPVRNAITTVGDLFPGHTESEFVDALAQKLDPPPAEFEYLYDQVTSRSEFQGTMAVPDIGRAGETLDLIAFIGTDARTVDNYGVDVGNINAKVTPTPGATALLGFAGLAAFRRRR